MGASLGLRRCSPDLLQEGFQAVAGGFPASGSEVSEREAAAGTLLHLGRQWEELQAALTGSDRGLSSVPSRVVLGGTVLGHSEEEQTMVIALRPREVSEVASYLRGVGSEEIRALVESHAGEIEEVLGEIDDWEAFRVFVSRSFAELRGFYAGAAEDGAAVVKLLY